MKRGLDLWTLKEEMLVRIVIHLRTLPYPPNLCTRPSLPCPQRHRAVPCGGIFAETPVPLTWVRQTLETLENSW